MKLTVLALVAFAHINAHALAAEKASSTSNWFILERDGKPLATIKETIRTDKKSVSIIQSRTMLGELKGTIETESVSVNNSKLTPSFLHSHTKTPATEIVFRISAKADGKVRQFEVTFDPVKGPGKFDKTRQPEDLGMVFSSALPLYLSKLESGFYVNYVITEDDAETAKIKSRYAKIRRMDETKNIAGEECSRSEVDLGGFPCTIWVNTNGILCEYDMPVAKTKIVRASQAKVDLLLKKAK